MIRRQVVFPVGVDRLWAALTDPSEAAAWLGGQMDWVVNEGSALRFTDDNGSERSGRIDAVRPGRLLRFRWWPSDGAGEVSEVTYLVEPDGDGSRLTVQERTVDSELPVEAVDAPLVCHDSTWTSWDSRMASVWATTLAANSSIVA